MDFYQLFYVGLLYLGVSSVLTCRICPREIGFCLKRITCGSGEINLQHSGLYTEIAKTLDHMLQHEHCEHNYNCRDFQSIHNVHFVEYNSKIFKYFQYDHDQCGLVLASAITCTDGCCQSTESAVTTIHSIKPNICRICPTRHSFCGNQNHACGIDNVSLTQSGVLYNLLAVTEHHGCQLHSECLRYSNIRNVHLFEENGRIYKYMQHGHTCSMFDTEDIHCEQGCCAASSNIINFKSTGQPSSAPILSNTKTLQSISPVQSTKPTRNCHFCPKTVHHPMCIRTVNCLTKSNMLDVLHSLHSLLHNQYCHPYLHCEDFVVDDLLRITEYGHHFLYFKQDDKCYVVLEDAVNEHCIETQPAGITTQSIKSTLPTKSPAVVTTQSMKSTIPMTRYICNKLEVITALAHSTTISNRHGLVCQDGAHSLSEAAVLQLCNTTESQQWNKGDRVVTACKEIPLYTAIAAFTQSGYLNDGVAGVLMDCNTTHIKIAYQDCKNSFQLAVVDVNDRTTYTRNALNYFVIHK